MDTLDHEEELRLGALYNRMGRLWADQEIDAWDNPPPLEKIDECKKILVGKLLSNPSINFPAFQSTMKRAWRIDQIEILPREAGLYVAHFKSESDKQRVLEGGPWQFSNHLVNFKPWIPNTPLPCYDFSTCAFWVHVVGLPLEWSSEQLLCQAVKRVGKVLEVKFDTNEGTNLRAGRVHVELKLNEPLQTGQLIRIAGEVLWLDFRYERLSHFCYSCGRLGHYAMHCQEIPFTDAKMEGKEKMSFGQWLKAEVKEFSPYWLTFYGKQVISEATEEVIPETPPFMITKVPALPPVEGTSFGHTSNSKINSVSSKMNGKQTAFPTTPNLETSGSQQNTILVLQTVAAPSRHHLPTCASLLPSPSTALVTRPTLDQGGSKSSVQPPVAPLQQILPAEDSLMLPTSVTMLSSPG